MGCGGLEVRRPNVVFRQLQLRVLWRKKGLVYFDLVMNRLDLRYPNFLDIREGGEPSDGDHFSFECVERK